MKKTLLAALVLAAGISAFADAVMSETVMTPRPDDRGLTVKLNGSWKVKFWPFDTEEARLVAPATDDSGWKSKQQPGKICYADPDGVNGKDKNTGLHLDAKDGAVIRRTVDVPPGWAGKRVYLSFDAVYPAADYYLDGKLLGRHFNGVTPVQFDVTGLVKPGSKALVALRLYRRHEKVQMDMFRHTLEFAGIWQDCRLFAVEPCHVADYHIVPDLNATLDKGTLFGEIKVKNDGAKEAKGEVVVTVTGKGYGKKKPCQAKLPFTAAAGMDATVRLALDVDNPALWNDEEPNLYRVEIAVKAAGQADSVVAYRTAFRRFELSEEGAKLNGNPVKFRGVNVLAFNRDGGMYQSKDFLKRSLSLMKKANVNCIRTHIQGANDLGDLCDEMGLYLVQDLTVDWGHPYIHKDDWMPDAHQRIEAGIRRDFHHPSVMIWNVGNETLPNGKSENEKGWQHLYEFEKLVKSLDSWRPCMFPPPGPANKITGLLELRIGDVADMHYSFAFSQEFMKTGKTTMAKHWGVNKPDATDDDFETWTREKALKRGWKGVWFSSEWGLFNGTPDNLHAPYVSVITDVKEDPKSTASTLDVFERRFNREWGIMRDSKNCLGGTYFCWICAGAGEGKEGNPWGWTRWAEEADWSVVCSDLTVKPFFWAMRLGYSPVYPFPSRLFWDKGQKEIRFKLHNGYNSIDFRDCRLRVYRQGGGGWMHMMNSYLEVPLQAAPGTDCEVVVPFTDGQLKGLEQGGYAFMRFVFLDPKGFRPIQADCLIFNRNEQKDLPAAFPIGPDGILQ